MLTCLLCHVRLHLLNLAIIRLLIPPLTSIVPIILFLEILIIIALCRLSYIELLLLLLELVLFLLILRQLVHWIWVLSSFCLALLSIWTHNHAIAHFYHHFFRWIILIQVGLITVTSVLARIARGCPLSLSSHLLHVDFCGRSILTWSLLTEYLEYIECVWSNVWVWCLLLRFLRVSSLSSLHELLGWSINNQEIILACVIVHVLLDVVICLLNIVELLLFEIIVVDGRMVIEMVFNFNVLSCLCLSWLSLVTFWWRWLLP